MTTLERPKLDIDKIRDPFEKISTAEEVRLILDTDIFPPTIKDSDTKGNRKITKKERVKLYRRLAMKYHPDRASENNKKLYHEILSKINTANDEIAQSPIIKSSNNNTETHNQENSKNTGTKLYSISQASDEELEEFLEKNLDIGLTVSLLKDTVKRGYQMTNSLENMFIEFLMKKHK